VVRNRQSKLIGKMGMLEFELRNEANLEISTQEIIKSTEIEGEVFDKEQLISSIARSNLLGCKARKFDSLIQ
jgi:hypothetical protein